MTKLRLRESRDAAGIDAVGWLTCYIVLLLFIPSRLVVGPLGSAGAPSMLFGLGSLILWFVALLWPGAWAYRRIQPIRMALTVFLASVGISYAVAMAHPMNPDEVSPADVALLALASWSGTMLLTHDVVRGRSHLDRIIWAFTVCAGLIATIGLLQFATHRLWVDEFSVPGLSSSPAYGLVTRGGFPRPSGTSIHPIEFGVLLTLMFPLALHVAFFHTHRPKGVRWLPALALSAVIPLTSSRSAYLGALIGLTVISIGWTARRRLRVAGVALVGTFVLAVVKPNFFNSVLGLFTGADEDPSIESRTDGFSLALQFLGQKPWFGRGLGTFLPKYRIFDNQYLLLLVTVGVVGTVAFLMIGVTAVISLVRLRRRMQDPESRDLAMALTAALCAGFVCLFMFDAFAFPMSMGALFLVLGCAGALRRSEEGAMNLLNSGRLP